MAHDLPNKLSMINTLVPNENLIVGGQPSINDLEYLKDLGVTTVVNLRPNSEPNDFEEASVVEKLGMNYCHIPLSAIDSFTKEACQKLHVALASNEPCLVHCATGNRVGALLALKSFWLDEHTAEQSLAYGKQTGLTKLEPQISNILGLVSS